MSAAKELIVYRKLLRTARLALQRIRDYEPGARMIAQGALEEIEQVGFPYGDSRIVHAGDDPAPHMTRPRETECGPRIMTTAAQVTAHPAYSVALQRDLQRHRISAPRIMRMSCEPVGSVRK
jgi:hypothetical protein